MSERFDFSNKSDFEIEAHIRTLRPESEPAIEALREQFRRRESKERVDRKTQKDIRNMTFVILVFTILTLIAALTQCNT